MRIATKRELEDIRRSALQQKDDIKEVELFKFWTKYRRYFQVIYNALMIMLVFFSRPFFNSIFKNEKTTIWTRVVIVAVVLLYIFITIPIHEFFHVLPHISGWKNWYITVEDFPKSVSVIDNSWVSKRMQMLSLIFPFLMFSVISLIIGISVGNVYIFMWMELINIGCSMTDIIGFVMVWKIVPKNAIMYEGFYTMDTNKE